MGEGRRGDQLEKRGRRSWVACPEVGRPGLGDLVPSPGARGRPHMEPCMSCALLQDYYYLSVKALYTVGYSTSLVTLTTAMVILCRFR